MTKLKRAALTDAQSLLRTIVVNLEGVVENLHLGGFDAFAADAARDLLNARSRLAVISVERRHLDSADADQPHERMETLRVPRDSWDL